MWRYSAKKPRDDKASLVVFAVLLWLVDFIESVELRIVSPQTGANYIPGAPIRVSLVLDLDPTSDADIATKPEEWLVCCGTRWLRKCAPLTSTALFLELRDSTVASDDAVQVSAWIEHAVSAVVNGRSAIQLRVPLSDEFRTSAEYRGAVFLDSIRDWHRGRSRDLAAILGCSELDEREHSCQCPSLDLNSRTMVCHSPKAMSKVIKVVLRKLANQTDYYDMKLTYSCPTPGLLSLTDVASWAAKRIIVSPNWRRFVVVRDPFARLASFYTDFQQRPVPLDKWSDQHTDDRDLSSFARFVHRVAQVPDESANEHVASQSHLCGLNTVHYDVVAYWPHYLDDGHDAVSPFLEQLCKHFGRPPEFCTSELHQTDMCDLTRKTAPRSARCFSRGGHTRAQLDVLFADQGVYELVEQRYLADLRFLTGNGYGYYQRVLT